MMVMMMTMMMILMMMRILMMMFTNSRKPLLKFLCFSLQAGEDNASWNEKHLFKNKFREAITNKTRADQCMIIYDNEWWITIGDVWQWWKLNTPDQTMQRIIDENVWKCMKMYENVWKCMKMYEMYEVYEMNVDVKQWWKLPRTRRCREPPGRPRGRPQACWEYHCHKGLPLYIAIYLFYSHFHVPYACRVWLSELNEFSRRRLSIEE